MVVSDPMSDAVIYARLPTLGGERPVAALPWGQRTIIVHDRATSASYARHTAPFSLKATLKGEEHYRVHGFWQTVRPGQYLTVNADQEYESEIFDETAVETFCVFFTQRDLAAALTAKSSDLDSVFESKAGLEFPGRVASDLDGLVMKRLRELRAAEAAEVLQQRERVLDLLAMLVADDLRLCSIAEQMTLSRRSTRREALRRCRLALAYMHEHYREDVSLALLADTAALSETHLIRCFRACLGATPSVVLAGIRLDRAASLLACTRQAVNAIAFDVGYTDFSAFSRAFRRRIGVTPSEWRSTASRRNQGRFHDDRSYRQL